MDVFRRLIFCLVMPIVSGVGALHADGTVESGSIESLALGVSKNYMVYLPEGYSESEKRYPVIYVLHGWGVTERIWTSPALNIQGLADSIDLQAIIVMPDADRNVYINALTGPEYNECMNARQPYPNNNEDRQEFCVRTHNYEDYFLQEVIPTIESSYRTITSREGRALSGESGGGLGSLQLALRHQQLFSSVASHSGITELLYDSQDEGRMTSVDDHPGLGGFEWMLGRDITRWQNYEPWSLIEELEDGVLSIYLDCGSEDGFFIYAQRFHEKLERLDIAHEYQWHEGGEHNDAQFTAGMENGLLFHQRHFKSKGIHP